MRDNHTFTYGDVIKHFKRETIEDKSSNEYLYVYFGEVTHSETKEKLICYKALYANDNIKFGQVFVRPYDMFMSEVDHVKYPNIKQKYRFEIFKSNPPVKSESDDDYND